MKIAYNGGFLPHKFIFDFFPQIAPIISSTFSTSLPKKSKKGSLFQVSFEKKINFVTFSGIKIKLDYRQKRRKPARFYRRVLRRITFALDYPSKKVEKCLITLARFESKNRFSERGMWASQSVIIGAFEKKTFDFWVGGDLLGLK